MHIETLKTFRDLVETASFTKAAQRNLISQSAVSQQLKMLESRYGCQLLERDRRGRVVVTEPGQQFYAGCRDLLDRFDVLEQRLRDRSAVVAGTIRVATVYSIGLHQLPPYVTRFMKAHPHVKVHLEYRRTDKVCEGCLDGSIDFGIVAFPVRRRNLTVVPWLEEPLVLVCAPQHALAGSAKVSVRNLNGEDFIAFERDIPTRKVVDRLLREHGVTVNRVMEFDNVETIKRAVEVGSGVSVLPHATVMDELQRGALVQLDFKGRFTRTIGMVYRRGRVLSGAAREFIQLMVPTKGEGGGKR